MLGEFKPKGLKTQAPVHGLSTQQFPVSAYVGSSKNLQDLKWGNAFFAVLFTEGRVIGLCWAKSKPRGSNGSIQFLKDLKGGGG
jgi:hypothetical protein